MPVQRLTAQKLHRIIQDRIGQLSSRHSPSQRIDRQTYDVCSRFHGFFGICSADANMLSEIREACLDSGLKIDDSEFGRGFIKASKRI